MQNCLPISFVYKQTYSYVMSVLMPEAVRILVRNKYKINDEEVKYEYYYSPHI